MSLKHFQMACITSNGFVTLGKNRNTIDSILVDGYFCHLTEKIQGNIPILSQFFESVATECSTAFFLLSPLTVMEFKESV